MAKHLTDSDVSAIVAIIDGWDAEKLTWDRICDAANAVVGKRPTRQSLHAHKVIKDAFSARKKGLKMQGLRQARPANLQIAADRIRNLESQVARLSAENSQLLEQFVVWQYNAYKHGLKEHQLNQPLPRIDRDRTED